MRYILEKLREWAIRVPSRTALLSETGSLSFDELDSLSDKIGSQLQSSGITEKQIVAISFRDKMHFVATLFGVLKSGAACALLSPDYPPKTFQTVLKQQKATYILSDWPVPQIPGCTRIDLTTVSARPLREVPIYPAPFRICTSGTTGLPKVNAIPLRVWNASLQGHVSFYSSIGKTDGRNGIFAAPEYAFGLTTVLLSLIQGQTAYLSGSSEYSNLFACYHVISHYQLTNAIWSAPVVNMISQSKILTKRLPNCLSTIGCSGAQLYLTPEFCEFCIGRGISIQNGYGTTETLGIMMNNVTLSYYCTHRGPVSVGFPFPGISAEIVDAVDSLLEGSLKLVFKDPAYDNLFPGNTIIGPDLVKMTEDGFVLLGRKDNVVKIRGNRVNLEAVESVLRAGARVGDVCIVPDKKDMALVCYYTAESELHTTTVEHLIRDYLPKYAQPVDYIRIQSFPRLPTGKIDRETVKKWGMQYHETKRD